MTPLPKDPSRRRWVRAAGFAGAVSMLPGCDGWWPAANREPWQPLQGWQGGWAGDSAARGHRLRHSHAEAATSSASVSTAAAQRTDVLIVGGGIAGLSCLRALVQAGVSDVHLLDLEGEVGGNSRGHRIHGLPCPVGAHYLPVPDAATAEVHDWLHEIGLMRRVAGRSVPDERHLCHSPQERLFVDGQWQEGLWPLPETLPGADAPALAREYQTFASAVERARQDLGFALPADRAPWTAAHAALDTQTFAAWLDAQGLRHPALRWVLDYACRDDYGAPAAEVSAWAGLHYFASRHGFRAPGVEADDEPVFTWPEGNAWLVRHLAAGHEGRVHTHRLVTAIAAESTGPGARWRVSCSNLATDAEQPWSARHVVLATPLFVAQRLLRPALNGTDPGAQALAAAAQAVPQAPWLVSNLHLSGPVADRHGAPPAWDNVFYGSATLGYVDASHQGLGSVATGPRVWTSYWALGGTGAAAALGLSTLPSKAPPADMRRALLDEPWTRWAERVCRPIMAAHPDLPRHLTRIELTRHGHAMATPAPGVRSHPALVRLRAQGLVPASGQAAGASLHLAHADLAGYSVFEEAFTIGHRVGRRIATSLGLARGVARRV